MQEEHALPPGVQQVISDQIINIFHSSSKELGQRNESFHFSVLETIRFIIAPKQKFLEGITFSMSHLYYNAICYDRFYRLPELLPVNLSRNRCIKTFKAFTCRGDSP